MSYSGKFKPKNPNKYKGNPSNIIYRSLLERRFMVYLDNNPSILKWCSEEIIIPYVSPVDNRVHRYFPDFWIEQKGADGNLRHLLIEVKPKEQCGPPKKPLKKFKNSRSKFRYLNAIKTWKINEAKWKAAEEFCADRKWTFKILTEDHLVK